MWPSELSRCSKPVLKAGASVSSGLHVTALCLNKRAGQRVQGECRAESARNAHTYRRVLTSVQIHVVGQGRVVGPNQSVNIPAKKGEELGSWSWGSQSLFLDHGPWDARQQSSLFGKP